MSGKVQEPNELSIQHATYTTVNLLVPKTLSLTSDEQLEYEKWPLINYERLEAKSVQELLFEAASEKDLKKYPEKWKLFRDEAHRQKLSVKKLRKMVSTPDSERQWTALHYAADCNNEDLCNILTSKEDKFQCNVNVLGGNGENVLHVISQSNCIWSNHSRTGGTPPLLTLLIKELDAHISHADDEGRTPLHLAAMRGRSFYAEYLIKRGAKVDVLSKLNLNVLHFALLPVNPMNAEELDSFVTYILKQSEAKTKLLDHCTLDNRTPLVFLAFHPAMIRSALVDKKEGQQAAKDSLMKTFTENITNKKQILLVFDMVARRKQPQQFDHLKHLLEISISKYEKQRFHDPWPYPGQILHLACRHNNVDLLRWLLNEPKAKEYCFTVNKAGYTPLLTAVFYNAKTCVEELIKSINDKSQSPFLAVGAMEQDNILHICAKRQVSEALFESVIKILSAESKEKLLRAKDNDGNLPLHLAVKRNTDKESYICKILIDEIKQIKSLDDSKSNGGGISQLLDMLCIKNRRGKTAAHEASEQGHEHILKIMWNALSLDEQKDRKRGLFITDDHNRLTCLHMAAISENDKRLNVVKYLVEEVHVEIDAIADRRLSSLHLACEYGHLDVVDYLIDKGASITLRNAQLFNCLEIAIQKQHEDVVKYLLQRPNWREMMRNAQPIENTDAYDTPMRKLIRYLPDITIWMIDEKLTRTVGGPDQKTFQEIYDYEFYEDMYVIKDWYAQGKVFLHSDILMHIVIGAELPPEDTSCKARCHKLGVNAIFGCYFRDTFCNSTVKDENYIDKDDSHATDMYSRDSYTLVRNNPLFIVSEQNKHPKLVAHRFHLHLRKKIFRRFSTYWLAFSFLFYIILLSLWTAVVLSGKHPQYFYSLANIDMTLDIDTCKQVSDNLVSRNVGEALKTNSYQRLKVAS
ncbi:unnamed protein product [Adineta ricciae]|uniref:Uncharacterized protein n=1 Tax=Adineta ricciae TaxID=249248 RepID=A0A816D0D6_ADIRI|nr:unnamed protein product [Adineta ricciae]CAF1626948.1 unnamed protein product [Adineta ricciae]